MSLVKEGVYFVVAGFFENQVCAVHYLVSGIPEKIYIFFVTPVLSPNIVFQNSYPVTQKRKH